MVGRSGVGPPLLGLPGSVALRRAVAAGLAVVAEAFVDRAYRADGSLVPRSEPAAVVHDPVEVCTRAVRMATEGEVVAIDGATCASNRGRCACTATPPETVALAQSVRDAPSPGPGRRRPLRRAMTVNVLPYGPAALLAEVADAAEVAALHHAALSAGAVDGIRAVVPAARTVLVEADPSRLP